MIDGAVLGIPLLITSIISVDLAFLAWRRSELPQKRTFIALNVCVAFLALTYLMELVSTDLAAMLFWNNLEYVSIVLLSPLYLAFAVQFVGKGAHLNWKTMTLLFAMSAVTLLFLWTNDIHHLFYRSVELIGEEPMTSYLPAYGIWFYVLMFYSLIVSVAAILILFTTYVRSSRVYRNQIRLVMLAGMIPIGAAASSIFLTYPLSLTMLLVLSFLASSILIFYGSFRYEMLDVMPLALDVAVERMTDGAVVVDRKYRVVYVNPAAGHVAVGNVADDRLKPLAEVLPELSRGDIESIVKGDTSLEVTITRLGAARTYDVRASELTDQAGSRSAILLILRDVTEEMQMRESMKWINTRLSIMSTVTRHATLDQVSIIRGYSEILSSSRQNEANVRRYAERIKDAVKYIESQLSFAMEYQDFGSSEPQWQWVQYALARAKTTGSSEGLKVESDLGTLTVMADPMLEKVFTILLDNTHHHGRGAKRASIGYRIEGGSCVITYQDDGPGIPAAKKESIFTRRDAGSDSLGLYIARQILEISKAEIREVGREGEGVKFEMIFPPGAWSGERVDNLKKVGAAKAAS